jgi:two-component system LytT family response regulator
VIVAGAAAGVDAAALVARLNPDILFLDIQMPQVDGFALLEQVGADAVPAIVFVTAFDSYAVRAFEVHALDYLLKPFTDARFVAALARAKQQVLARREGVLDARIADLLRAQRLPGRVSSCRRVARPWWSTHPRSTGSRQPTTTYACIAAARTICCARRWTTSKPGSIRSSSSACTVPRS